MQQSSEIKPADYRPVLGWYPRHNTWLRCYYISDDQYIGWYADNSFSEDIYLGDNITHWEELPELLPY